MYEYRQSCSLFKITLFLLKIHLMLLKVREYRESHILCEKDHSSLYLKMDERASIFTRDLRTCEDAMHDYKKHQD